MTPRTIHHGIVLPTLNELFGNPPSDREYQQHDVMSFHSFATASHRMHGDRHCSSRKDARLIYSVTKKLTIAAAVALLFVSGAARAQLGSLTPNPSLGIAGSRSTVGGTGIPIGATQLPDRGLSPAPLGVTPGAAPVGSNMPNTIGLGPNIPTPGSFAPAAPTFGITNFGAGGVQSLPGSPRSGTAGTDH
jgi:hypothetical protein